MKTADERIADLEATVQRLQAVRVVTGLRYDEGACELTPVVQTIGELLTGEPSAIPEGRQFRQSAGGQIRPEPAHI